MHLCLLIYCERHWKESCEARYWSIILYYHRSNTYGHRYYSSSYLNFNKINLTWVYIHPLDVSLFRSTYSLENRSLHFVSFSLTHPKRNRPTTLLRTIHEDSFKINLHSLWTPINTLNQVLSLHHLEHSSISHDIQLSFHLYLYQSWVYSLEQGLYMYNTYLSPCVYSSICIIVQLYPNIVFPTIFYYPKV